MQEDVKLYMDKNNNLHSLVDRVITQSIAVRREKWKQVSLQLGAHGVLIVCYGRTFALREARTVLVTGPSINFAIQNSCSTRESRATQIYVFIFFDIGSS